MINLAKGKNLTEFVKQFKSHEPLTDEMIEDQAEEIIWLLYNNLPACVWNQLCENLGFSDEQQEEIERPLDLRYEQENKNNADY